MFAGRRTDREHVSASSVMMHSKGTLAIGSLLVLDAQKAHNWPIVSITGHDDGDVRRYRALPVRFRSRGPPVMGENMGICLIFAHR